MQLNYKKIIYILLFLFDLLFCPSWPLLSQNKTFDTLDINVINEKSLSVIISDTSLSKKLAIRALKLSREHKYFRGESLSLSILGSISYHKFNNLEALNFYNESLKLRLLLKNQKDIANAYNNIGQVYEKLGKYDSALDNYLKALNLRVDNNFKEDIPISFNNVASIFERQEKYKDALSYYYKSLFLNQHSHNIINSSISNNNIGSIYVSLKNADSSIFYFNKALLGYIEAHDSSEISNEYSNLAAVYINQNKYEDGIKYLNKALPIAQKLGIKESQTEILINMGAAYIGLKRYEVALEKLFKAEDLAKEIKSPALLRDIYSNISDANDSLKNYQLAYEYYKKYSVINDSLVSLDKSKQLIEMQTKYDTEKKEQERDKAISSEHLRTRQLYFASLTFLLFLVLATTAFFFYQQRVRNKEILAAKNVTISNQKINELLNQQEIKSFEAMIEGQEQERKRIAEDLHDGLGILLSTVKLHFSAIEEKLDRQINTQEQFVKGTNLLDEALQEVRRIAHNMSSGLLTNIGLVPALADLKESLELGSRLKVNLFTHNMESRLDVLTEISIYRIIQELMSNILKHAHASEISINLNKDIDTNLLTLMIEDDGVGFDTNAWDGAKGMGISNIAQRATRLKGKFNIDSVPGKGTTAIIEIPV